MNDSSRCVEERAAKLAEIRERVTAAVEAVSDGARTENGKVIVGLTFEDETQLAERWLLAIADCKRLLAIIDGVNPV